MLFLVFLIGVVLSDVHQYNMIPPDNFKPYNDSNLGICYGSSTSWSSYPYTVALRYSSGSACCSGSIISLNPGIILTAAHCNGCTGQLRVGCNNPLNCNGDSYTIQQFIQNPAYGSPLQFSNDIAVLRTTQPITTSGARTITVPSVEPNLGTLRVTGYGITQSGGIPTTLQTMTSNEIERNQCQAIMSSALGGGQYVDQTMICIRSGNAGQDGVPTMCSGDSGGPMANTGSSAIYGVNSWVLQGSGTGCNGCNCCPGYPQVGASVAHASQWINGYLGEWKKKYFNATVGEL